MAQRIDSSIVETIEFALEEDILLFLDKYNRYKDDYEVPYAVSQRGIATAVGLVINNLPRTLKKLIDKGLIEVQLRRVKGAPRRLKTYFLTESRGAIEAHKILRFINETTVVLKKYDRTIKEITIAELNKHRKRRMHPFDLINLLNNNYRFDNDNTNKNEKLTIQTRLDNKLGECGCELERISRCIIAPKFRRRNRTRNHHQPKNNNGGDGKQKDNGENGKGLLNQFLFDVDTDGRMSYYAKVINGKSSNGTRTVPVKLTITTKADFEILSKYGIAAMRRYKIQRLTNEAYRQGGLLTQKDLVSLICSSLRTIKKDFHKLRNRGTFIPTKGQIINRHTDLIHGKNIEKYLKYDGCSDIKMVT